MLNPTRVRSTISILIFPKRNRQYFPAGDTTSHYNRTKHDITCTEERYLVYVFINELGGSDGCGEEAFKTGGRETKAPIIYGLTQQWGDIDQIAKPF